MSDPQTTTFDDNVEHFNDEIAPVHGIDYLSPTERKVLFTIGTINFAVLFVLLVWLSSNVYGLAKRRKSVKLLIGMFYTLALVLILSRMTGIFGILLEESSNYIYTVACITSLIAIIGIGFIQVAKLIEVTLNVRDVTFTVSESETSIAQNDFLKGNFVIMCTLLIELALAAAGVVASKSAVIGLREFYQFHDEEKLQTLAMKYRIFASGTSLLLVMALIISYCTFKYYLGKMCSANSIERMVKTTRRVSIVFIVIYSFIVVYHIFRSDLSGSAYILDDGFLVFLMDMIVTTLLESTLLAFLFYQHQLNWFSSQEDKEKEASKQFAHLSSYSDQSNYNHKEVEASMKEDKSHLSANSDSELSISRLLNHMAGEEVNEFRSGDKSFRFSESRQNSVNSRDDIM